MSDHEDLSSQADPDPESNSNTDSPTLDPKSDSGAKSDSGEVMGQIRGNDGEVIQVVGKHVHPPQTEVEKKRHDLHCQMDIKNYQNQMELSSLRKKKEEVKMQQEIKSCEWTMETLGDEKKKNELQTTQSLIVCQKQLEFAEEQIHLQQKRDRLKFSEEINEIEHNKKKRKLQHEIDLIKLNQEKKLLSNNQELLEMREKNELLKLKLEFKDKEMEWRSWVDQQPERLLDPVKQVDSLTEITISDRMIKVPIVITAWTAEGIIERLQYYNNQNNQLPIS